jgi:hypothetical protein
MRRPLRILDLERSSLVADWLEHLERSPVGVNDHGP